MASITVRGVDDAVKNGLKVRAAEHGRSMEEEIREILRTTVASERAAHFNLADKIRARFARFGGVELPIPRRSDWTEREPPKAG